MSKSAHIKIQSTKSIPCPNPYIQALFLEQKKGYGFDETKALSLKGKWKETFKAPSQKLNLEIGTGSGRHFSYLCEENPQESFLGIELKYKPLIQTIRRVRKKGCENGKVIRFNARLLDQVFEEEELNDIYIHFPDPWLKKKRQKKHQLLNLDFCKILFSRQKKSSLLEFKTDSLDYFLQSVERLKKAGFKLKEENLDLYKDFLDKKDLGNQMQISQFELIFLKKRHPIKRALFIK